MAGRSRASGIRDARLGKGQVGGIVRCDLLVSSGGRQSTTGARRPLGQQPRIMGLNQPARVSQMEASSEPQCHCMAGSLRDRDGRDAPLPIPIPLAWPAVTDAKDDLEDLENLTVAANRGQVFALRRRPSGPASASTGHPR